jgi:pimeloyl-ACP methyl ester carboxylesterase
VWEDLPADVIRQEPGLIALVPDVNGFGGTPFASVEPPVEQCTPPALMSALEGWLDLLALHSGGGQKKRPFLFVGHSMGGAALFFLDESRWGPGEIGRVAAAPALLFNDRARRRFYRALGAGIRIGRWSDLADRITEKFIAPRVIDALAGGASDFVRAEHQRIFCSTPEEVMARTFEAMVRLEADFERQAWPHFRVLLAHRDRLVGLQPTLELLEGLNFLPSQIRVALGDHYFFSVGRDARQHAENRALLIADILDLYRSLDAVCRAGSHP